MNNFRTFKQKLSSVSRLWEKKSYDKALAEVESLLNVWPGNSQLHILRASLIQLQEHPKNSLDEAKDSLQHAVDLDKTSPAATIELAHFLDSVADEPLAASKAYAKGIAVARQQLIEGLIGQAKVLIQLDKRQESFHCLMEVLQLARAGSGFKQNKGDEPGAEIIYSEEVQELLSEVASHRSV
jgi:hypothetical protein